MTHYTWQVIFDRLEGEGPQRIITLFKLALKEMPRLEKAFTHAKEQTQAAAEIRALFSRVEIEMTRAMTNSRLSPEEFIKEVRSSKNFTPVEWEQLARVPELIGHHHKELFTKRAFNTPKKRTPFFKV